LTGREDFTRVQLQKQRVGEHHHHYSASIVGDRIPGFKTSAGKFCLSCLDPFFILIGGFGECLSMQFNQCPHTCLQLIDDINTCTYQLLPQNVTNNNQS
jgi:hypothetical protein